MTPLTKTSNNNNNNNNKAILGNAIPRDVPLFVGGDAAGHVFRSVSISLPPSLSRERSLESPNTNTKALKKSESSPVALLHKQKNPSADHWVWKVKLTILTPIPMYHPLDRTALKLDNLTLQTVTARISDFMRMHSIKCYYHDDAARVDCLTETLVKFAIHLWRGQGQGLPETTETNPSQIIVEVQRRQGCPIEMQSIRRYLYHAIQTGDAGVPKDTNICKFRASGRCDLIQRVVEHQYQHQQGKSNATANITPRYEEPVFPDALEICKDLLDSDHFDQHRLGLESLCCLTDPTKVRSQDSDRISRTIIYGEPDGDKSLQDNFETYFCGIEMPMGNDSDDNSGYDSEQDDKTLAYEQGNYFGAMHILSLRVLSHSLESIVWQKAKGTASLSLAPLDLKSLFWCNVLQALYYNLEVAAHRPLEASLSAKCLRLLQSLEPHDLQVGTNGKMHLLSSLESANQYGKAHSLSLEQESEQLMGRFEFAF